MWTPPPLGFDCPTQDCTAFVQIKMDDFEDCFQDSRGGWDFPNFQVGGQQIDMQDCIDQSNNNNDACVLSEQLTPDAPDPCCALEADITSGAVECCAEQDIADADGSLFDSWVAFFEEFCPQADLVVAAECDNSDPPISTQIECQHPTSRGLGANIQLVADPILSEITVTGPGINYTSSVTAFGSASSAPTKFLRAYGEADDVYTSAGWLTNVHFIHAGDASATTSGQNYSVANTQFGDVVVQGTLNGVQKSWGLTSSGSTASGKIMLIAGSWYMNYSGTSGGYTVTLHLEGDATSL